MQRLCAKKQYSNKQAEQWKTTIYLLYLNQEEGHAEAGKIIRFIGGKSIVVFHCSACLLQDFCNLLLVVTMVTASSVKVLAVMTFPLA